MSYSYIKSVFPNFEDSSKVYDDAIYSNILSAKREEKTHDKIVQQNDQYYNSDKETFILPQTNLLETFNNNNVMNTSNKIEDVNKNLKTIEKFEGGDNFKDCDIYINHITNCDRCRSILMKQLNIESDNKRNEELMELISYLIFAIFILLLVNSLKTPR